MDWLYYLSYVIVPFLIGIHLGFRRYRDVISLERILKPVEELKSMRFDLIVTVVLTFFIGTFSVDGMHSAMVFACAEFSVWMCFVIPRLVLIRTLLQLISMGAVKTTKIGLNER